MDFTLSKYKELLNFFKDKGYRFHSVSDYLEEDSNPPLVILRHDVDRNPTKSLNIAELERDYDIKSTYYFRYPHTFGKEIIEKISNLGHEIGYHYEVLSKADGNYERAMRLFEKELKEFRKLSDIKTICMHGNPKSRYDNRELWEFIDFEEHQLLGEAYFSIDDFDIYYFTDTGRRWDNKYNLRDRYKYKNVEGVKSTEKLIGVLNDKKIDKLYITTHPERWGEGLLDSFYLWTKDFAFNIGKKAIQLKRK